MTEQRDSSLSEAVQELFKKLTAKERWLACGVGIVIVIMVVIAGYLFGAWAAKKTMSAEIHAYLQLFVESLRILIWPIVVLVLVRWNLPVLRALVPRLRTLSIKIPSNGEVGVTVADVTDVTESLLQDVDDLIAHLDIESKALMKVIVDRLEAGKAFTIRDDFRRTSDANATEKDKLLHLMLRDLRDCKLIRPAGGGKWAARSDAVIPAFGRFLLSYRREAIVPEMIPDTVRKEVEDAYKK